ncbi:peroxidase-related enzyme [Granulicella cerasi]|uniref:Peroxidase-related enzyme n=1 Tax=Granulicella cerasi TaxID=741063 RepID=A0ABW1ZBT5_9BACT|nr:peroxidase-related enzyme [Granulicella cerasi]
MANIPFTLEVLKWRPWAPAVKLEEANEAQMRALTAAGAVTRDSPYFRTLAHAPEALSARMALYNDIVYSRDGLSRAEREFSMFAVSRVNGCVYCASIHGRRFIELGGAEDVIHALLASDDTSALDARLAAIFEYARKITVQPESVGPSDHEVLQRAGLSEAECLDLLHATSMFSWANTLMMTLGDYAVATV